MKIGKCVEWVVRVCLVICSILGIMRMSLCVGIYKWISTMGLRSLLAIGITCR